MFHINLVSILTIHHTEINQIFQVILYVGLGMISVGLVITFVGLGEKGFKTLELKLIGPSLVGCGVFFALLRVLFCTLPSCCRSLLIDKKKTKNKNKKEKEKRQKEFSSAHFPHAAGLFL